MAGSTVRPNIRIEIHNNLMEPMEVDEPGEEGEISDTNETVNEPPTDSVENPQVSKQRIWPNANGGFTTGINIFDKEEQSKLQERAKRFCLNANEINNFTDEQLQALHDSLGITAEDEKDIRFEAIHMRGTDDMSTGDVLEYFGKYGPAAIEWIDDTSCNVLWNDRISTARALFFLSKRIKEMPVEGPCDPFAKETVESSVDDKENEGRSILLKNKDREVELREEPEDEMIEEEEEEEEETVSVSTISVPIPPGYWRLGVKCIKAKCILLRFAFKSDKKPHKAEKFSEYYKKYGNPNYGGLKGLITDTHKKKFKGIFDRNKDIKENIVDPKNPWGSLAMNWSEDLKYCEKEITVSQPSPTKFKSDIMSRLGFKRALDIPKEETDVVEKKTKVPRMRMYADEEEEKIKRKKQLQKLKHTTEQKSDINVDDLRNILNVQSRKATRVENKSENDVLNVDLAVRLKNRSRHLDHSTQSGRSNSKEKEIRIRKSKETKHKSDYKDYLKERSKHASLDKYERRMHSDNYRSRSRRDNYDYTERNLSDEEHDRHKPKSKIAVVIKTQKTPAVASAVWSRIHSDRERLKTVSESKLRRRRSSSSESSDSSSSSSSSSASSSPESSNSEDETETHPSIKSIKTDKLERPGFNDTIKTEPDLLVNEQRNSLRIEISNDHFRNK